MKELFILYPSIITFFVDLVILSIYACIDFVLDKIFMDYKVCISLKLTLYGMYVVSIIIAYKLLTSLS